MPGPRPQKLVGYHGFQPIGVKVNLNHNTSGIPAAPQVKIFFDERWPPAGSGSVGAAAW